LRWATVEVSGVGGLTHDGAAAGLYPRDPRAPQKSPRSPPSCTISLSCMLMHIRIRKRPVRRFTGHVFVHIAQDGVLESIARNGA
jgi:hypothetical protein